MPTSNACSQLQCHRPLKAKLWLAGATKASNPGSSGGVDPSGPSQAKTHAERTCTG